MKLRGLDHLEDWARAWADEISARRGPVVIKAHFGYPKPAPVTLDPAVLESVLRGLRDVAPRAEVWVIEGVCTAVAPEEVFRKLGVDSLCAQYGVRLADADSLPSAAYPNQRLDPGRFKEILAPALLGEARACMALTQLKRTTLKGVPLVSGLRKSLFGLPPRAHYRARSPHSRGQLHRPGVPAVIEDLWGCLGHLNWAGVCDARQVYFARDWHPDRGESRPGPGLFAGTDLLAVDHEATAAAVMPLGLVD